MILKGWRIQITASLHYIKFEKDPNAIEEKRLSLIIKLHDLLNCDGDSGRFRRDYYKGACLSICYSKPENKFPVVKEDMITKKYFD